MSGRKLLATFGAVILATGLAASPAGATKSSRKCGPGLCTRPIHACIHDQCKRLRGKERSRCRKACKSSIIEACKIDMSICTGGSPEGAFVGNQ
jgi:hypothetical protein